MDRADLDAQLAQLTILGDPVRRALYHYVAGRRDPVGRDEAAAAVGIGRPLAVYHLDRLVAEGLLEASYQRRGDRRGPGAGRPAKLYVRSRGQVEVSLPPRDYELAARILARAADADPSGTARRRVEDAARAIGGQLAAGEHGAALLDTLRRHGYEPYLENGAIRLRNCPFDKLAAEHRELMCHANLALLQGVVERLGAAGVEPALSPRPGECCVSFEPVKP
jgi:predicted ArsR family transcriptional regulator